MSLFVFSVTAQNWVNIAMLMAAKLCDSKEKQKQNRKSDHNWEWMGPPNHTQVFTHLCKEQTLEAKENKGAATKP